MTADKYHDIFRLIKKAEQSSIDWDLDAVEPVVGIRRLLFLNAHAVTTAAENVAFRQALLDCDLLLRDGIGLELAFKLLGCQPTENLNGTDLIPKVLERFKTRKIAVWGSSEEALDKLRQRLVGEGFGNLAPMHHGFHEDVFYVEEFEKERPDVVVLCMGMPRQELLGQKLALPGHDCLVVCGGGWANFHSGHVTRAPKGLRRLKLEWLHRLAVEPRRVGRRYTVGVVSFFVTVYRARSAGRR